MSNDLPARLQQEGSPLSLEAASEILALRRFLGTLREALNGELKEAINDARRALVAIEEANEHARREQSRRSRRKPSLSIIKGGPDGTS